MPKPAASTLSSIPPVADRARRKIFRRLIPFLFILYIIAYLDRANVAFANLSMFAYLHWLPATIRNASGLSVTLSTVCSALPFALAMVTIPLVGRSSDKTGKRKLHTIVPLVLWSWQLAFSSSVRFQYFHFHWCCCSCVVRERPPFPGEFPFG